MREIRMLRATWRGLETWRGQEALALPARQSSTRPITIRKANEAPREILARGPACNGGSRPAGFVASPRTHLGSRQANTGTRPFFGERPIQGFFNKIGRYRSSRSGSGLKKALGIDVDRNADPAAGRRRGG